MAHSVLVSLACCNTTGEVRHNGVDQAGVRGSEDGRRDQLVPGRLQRDLSVPRFQRVHTAPPPGGPRGMPEHRLDRREAERRPRARDRVQEHRGHEVLPADALAAAPARPQPRIFVPYSAMRPSFNTPASRDPWSVPPRPTMWSESMNSTVFRDRYQGPRARHGHPDSWRSYGLTAERERGV